MKSEEIRQALSRHPYEVSYFGPLLPGKPFDEIIPFPTGGYNRFSVADEDVVTRAGVANAELTKYLVVGDLKLVVIKKAEMQSYYGDLTRFLLQVETPNKELLDCQLVLFQRYWLKETKLDNVQCKPAAAASNNNNKKQ